MQDSYYKKVNLLSPEYDKDLMFDRSSLYINIIDAFFVNLHNYEYPYTHPIDSHNFYELNMITNGYCMFDFPGQDTITVTQGNFIIIPPHTKHKLCFESSSITRTKFFFNFNSKEDDNTSFMQMAQNTLKKKLVFAYNEQIKTLLSLMVDASKNMYPEYKASIFLHAIAYIMEILRVVSKGQAVKESRTEKILNHATEYIQLNASATLSVSDVAEYVKISPKQLTRIFCNNLGVSPGKYIKDCRISRITDFLLFSNLSIADIAETMEYPDYASLINAFKRAKGITPTQYRNKTKNY